LLGFRGASRFIDPSFRACFELECRALRRVREQMGLVNVQIMVPFVRTLGEARAVSELLADNGLKRAPGGLQLIMMCELPTNALLADQYLEYSTACRSASNDMTQLTLGLDRDSGVIAHLFDERDPAVKAMMAMAIQACRKAGKYAGICGQGPSGPPRSGSVAGGSGHRIDVAESGYGGRDLAEAGGQHPLIRSAAVSEGQPTPSARLSASRL